MDISTLLYREGGLVFVPDEYFSFGTDKIWERGGRSVILRFFFITIQIFLSWKVVGLLIFVSPKP